LRRPRGALAAGSGSGSRSRRAAARRRLDGSAVTAGLVTGQILAGIGCVLRNSTGGPLSQARPASGRTGLYFGATFAGLRLGAPSQGKRGGAGLARRVLGAATASLAGFLSPWPGRAGGIRTPPWPFT
jgi:hypothetical protein